MPYEWLMQVAKYRSALSLTCARLIFLIAALLTITVGVFPDRSASAHVRLLVTSPKSDTLVTQPLKEVTLVFNEPGLKPTFTTVVVLDAAGRNYADGPIAVQGASIIQPVKPLPAATIRVAWRTVSADGHPVEDHFSFTVAPEAADLEAGEIADVPVASPPAANVDDAQPVPSEAFSSTSKHFRTWTWALIAGVVLLGVAALTLLWRRSPSRSK